MRLLLDTSLLDTPIRADKRPGIILMTSVFGSPREPSFRAQLLVAQPLPPMTKPLIIGHIPAAR